MQCQEDWFISDPVGHNRNNSVAVGLEWMSLSVVLSSGSLKLGEDGGK